MRCVDWEIKGYDRDSAVELVRRGINPLPAVLLASRGITDPVEIERLTSTDISYITDPFEIKDMDLAVDRLKKAVAEREHVAVFGDYDVDGITSACMLSEYFRSLGLKCETYVPERLEGYGVVNSAIEALHSLGATLVVTVDCGITAVDEVEYARSLGVDMVITDHHECGEILPSAAAVVNPKRRDGNMENSGLAGVGVAFKLVCAMEGPEHTDALIDRFGDLLALGTIADVMPVTGENRYFIRRGIERIGDSPRPGIRKLCEVSGLGGRPVTVPSVGFILAPRLNAAGRMGKTASALELLMTGSEERAEALAVELGELNRERQDIALSMFNDALEMLKKDPQDEGPIVLSGDGWSQGVAGIVASRVSEQFQRPAVMICLQDGYGRGSCRSVPGFNIYNALSECSDILEQFGGHDMSAGLSILEKNIPELRERLRDNYRRTADLTRCGLVSIDFEIIKPGLLTTENVESLDQLEPFGNGNPPPVLCIRNAAVTSVVPLSGGRHTKLWIWKDGENYECIFFTKSPEDIGVSAGDSANVAFMPKVNEFRGRRSVQLSVMDIAAAESGNNI